MFVETSICTTRQRDALAARVKRLEDAGDAMANAIEEYGCYGHSHLPAHWREAKGQA